jgi:hypothetical protein
MNRSTVTAIGAALFIAAACGATTTSQSPAETASSPTASPVESSDASDVSRFFAIEEIGLGSEGYVTLLNYTEASASLDSMFLCQADACVDLPDVMVGPGEVARIAVGDGTGLENVAMTRADLDLAPGDGEVAVFHSEDVSDKAEIRAYLQWGSTPHELTKVAVEAGLWIETGYAPTGPSATRLWKTEGNLWVWDSGQ